MLACVMDTFSNGKDNQISNNLWIGRTTNCAAPAEGANNESACKGAKIAYGLLEGAEDAEAPDKMSKGKVLPIYQLKETRLDMKSGTVY